MDQNNVNSPPHYQANDQVRDEICVLLKLVEEHMGSIAESLSVLARAVSGDDKQDFVRVRVDGLVMTADGDL